MKKNPSGRIFYFLSCLFFILTFWSCKKEDDTPDIKPEQFPNSIKIKAAHQKGINAFTVVFAIETDSTFSFDSYGLVIAKDSIFTMPQANVRMYELGSISKLSLKEDSVFIDSLEGSTTYHLKAFVKKGAQYFLSSEHTITTGGLKLMGIQPGRNGFYASRGEEIYLKINFNDNTLNAIESKIKIGGVEAQIIADYNDFILLNVPQNLTAGKKSLEIRRNGLTLFIADTLDILRGSFESLSDFPYTYRSHYGDCQIGNTGYMIGGSIYANSGPLGWYNDVLTYDLNTLQWQNSSIANYPSPYIIDFCTFVVNNKIYALPGRDEEYITWDPPSSRKVYEYDPVQNKWAQKASFPGSKRLRTSGFVLNDKIYLFGGFGKDATNSEVTINELWEYTPATDTWMKKTDFPGSSAQYPAIFTYGDKAYIFGGFNPQHHVTNEFWEYDQQKNIWTAVSLNENIHRRFRTTFFVIGNKGYMLEGIYVGLTGLGYDYFGLNDNWEIDLTTKKWSRISDFTIKNTGIGYNWTPFYMKTCVYNKDGKAIIYDNGKMYRFTAD